MKKILLVIILITPTFTFADRYISCTIDSEEIPRKHKQLVENNLPHDKKPSVFIRIYGDGRLGKMDYKADSFATGDYSLETKYVKEADLRVSNLRFVGDRFNIDTRTKKIKFWAYDSDPYGSCDYVDEKVFWEQRNKAKDRALSKVNL